MKRSKWKSTTSWCTQEWKNKVIDRKTSIKHKQKSQLYSKCYVKKLVQGCFPTLLGSLFPPGVKNLPITEKPSKASFWQLGGPVTHLVTSGDRAIHRCFCCRGSRNLTPARQLSPAVVSGSALYASAPPPHSPDNMYRGEADIILTTRQSWL